MPKDPKFLQPLIHQKKVPVHITVRDLTLLLDQELPQCKCNPQVNPHLNEMGVVIGCQVKHHWWCHKGTSTFFPYRRKNA